MSKELYKPYKEKIAEYKNSSNIYPLSYQDISEENKNNPQWYRKICEGLIANYYQGFCSWGGSKVEDFITNSLYLNGMQPTEKYMDSLSPKDKNGERKGYNNIDWAIIPIIPKFVSIIEGMFDKIEQNVSAEVIDNRGISEKNNKKWKIWATIEIAKKINEQITPEQMGVPFIPQTLSELEMMSDSGLLKLDAELQIEAAVENSLYHSKWREQAKRLYAYELLRSGIAATKDYIDPADGLVKAEWLNTERLIIPYSEKRTYDDVDMFGYVRYYTISQLRPILYEWGYTEEDIYNIAQSYSGFGNNTNKLDYQYNQWRSNNGYYQYDNHRIAVMDAEWDSNDKSVYRKETTESGRNKFKKVDKNYKEKNTNKNTNIKLVEKTRHTICTAKWVIGTDIVFEWGEMQDMSRSTSKNNKNKDIANHSFHVYKLTDNPIIGQLIPMADAIQKSCLRIQNIMNTSAPAGVAVEFSALGNIKLGGKKLSEFDVLRIRNTEGTLIYRANPLVPNPIYNPNSGKIIQELRGGGGEKLNEEIREIERNLQLIRETLGMNPIVDSSLDRSEPPGLGVSKLLSVATNNALQPIYSAYLYIKEETATSIASRSQLIANYEELRGSFIQNDNIKTVSMGKDAFSYEVKVKLKQKPTAEEKQILYEQINIAEKVPLTDGGISYADAIRAKRLVEDGKTKEAEIYLIFKEKQNKEYAAYMQQQNILMQQQASVETENAKTKLFIQQKQIETQSQLDIIRVKAEEERKTLELQLKLKSDQIQFMAGVDTANKHHKDMTEIEKAHIKKNHVAS